MTQFVELMEEHIQTHAQLNACKLNSKNKHFFYTIDVSDFIQEVIYSGLIFTVLSFQEN